MKRRDDDIVVHRNAPLQGILYMRHNTRKKLTTGSSSPVKDGIISFFKSAARFAAFPFYAAYTILKPQKGKHETPEKPDVTPCITPPVTDMHSLSRVLTKRQATQGKRTVHDRLVTAVAAVSLVICVTSVLYIPKAFATKKMSVTINDSGVKVTALSSPKTVQALLQDCGITIGQNDIVETNVLSNITDDMEVVIRRAMPLTISTMQKDNELYMLSGTVQDALVKSGVSLDENDEVYPSQDTAIHAGMVIDVVTVDVKNETVNEKIGYKEISRKNPDIKIGKEITVQDGKEGLRETKYETVYKNGVEVSKKTLSTEVKSDPVDEIVEIGTRTTILMEKTPRTSEIYSKTLAEHKKMLKPAPEIIDKVLVADYVTAYTHTGHRTATGTYPRIGTVAVDPKKIPYGTKIYIPGYGYGRTEDTGAFRGKDFLQLDLFMDTEQDCLDWGRKRDIKIYILE